MFVMFLDMFFKCDLAPIARKAKPVRLEKTKLNKLKWKLVSREPPMGTQNDNSELVGAHEA